MRNSKSHSKTIRSKLVKCSSIFNAFNDLQYRYGLELDKRSDIKEIKVNVKLVGCIMGDTYTTDFYCMKSNGEYMVRECVYKDRLLKPLNVEMLDASRSFWLGKGITDWGIVLDA